MPKITSCFIYVLTFFCFKIHAQYLHTPSDLENLIKKSSVEYLIDSSDTKIDLLPKTYDTLKQGWRVTKTSEGSLIERPIIKTNKQTRKYQKKAKNRLNKLLYRESIAYYKKILEIFPDNLDVMRSIGSIYQLEKDYETAIYWYENVLDRSKHDFAAHQLLATTHQLNDSPESALYHITAAHLLNRNDSTILSQLKEIYNSQKKPFLDFNFSPIYKITHQDSSKVTVHSQEIPWKAFGICKAFWAFEKGYQEKMIRMSYDPVEDIQTKECLLNAVIAYESVEDKEKKYPELKALSLAIGEDLIDQYILYEIISPSYPLNIYLLTDEEFQKLIEYFKLARVSS